MVNNNSRNQRCPASRCVLSCYATVLVKPESPAAARASHRIQSRICDAVKIPAEIRHQRVILCAEVLNVRFPGWGSDDRLDVLHAWLIEDLSDNRVRLLTQETQNGKPAVEPAKAQANPMINGHQDWRLVKLATRVHIHQTPIAR